MVPFFKIEISLSISVGSYTLVVPIGLGRCCDPTSLYQNVLHNYVWEYTL